MDSSNERRRRKLRISQAAAIIVASIIGALATYLASRPQQERRVDEIANFRQLLAEQAQRVESLARDAREKDEIIRRLTAQQTQTSSEPKTTQPLQQAQTIPSSTPTITLNPAPRAEAVPVQLPTNADRVPGNTSSPPRTIADTAEPSPTPSLANRNSASLVENPTEPTEAAIAPSERQPQVSPVESSVPQKRSVHREEREIINVRVPAITEWFDSGVVIHDGDDVEISAKGNVGTATYSVLSGPDGQPYICEAVDCIIRSRPFGVLVGRVGDDGGSFIVGSKHAYRSRRTGELSLTINDKTGNYRDNRGSYAVTIVIFHHAE